MLFNSAEYALFFLSVLVVSWAAVGVPRLRIWILLLASYYFYASNSRLYLGLILVSTQIDYLAGLALGRTSKPSRRRAWLTASIVTNLGLLGFFKYANFFAASASELLTLVGYRASWVDLNVILPIGISFYTFQSMSYTIDAYRGRIPIERSWLRFSFYVAFFPQLVAGPIVRARDFLPQLGRRPVLSRRTFEWSVLVIARGLVKKIVLADGLAPYADRAFEAPDEVSLLGAWIGIVAFTFQIYFDFSGYTDIARGSARLLGYRLPINFRRPYAATSITDFWRRWHISLSTWLRDYLYIPLGGNRMAQPRGVYRNLMLTMLLGGLWHGAAWHFVAWGGVHGLLLCIERSFGIDRVPRHTAAAGLARRVATFGLVAFSWTVFRVEDWAHLQALLGRLVSPSGPFEMSVGELAVLGVAAASFAIQNRDDRSRRCLRGFGWPWPLRALACAAALIAAMVFNAGESVPFIYFQF